MDNTLLTGIMVYTEDDSGNIYFVLNNSTLTQLIDKENITEFKLGDHTFQLSEHQPCDMGEGYQVYLHCISYEEAKKISKEENMELISYKELYESDNRNFSRDFRNKLTIALAEKTFGH